MMANEAPRDQPNPEGEKFGAHKALVPRKFKPHGGAWYCRVCAFGPMGHKDKQCVNCGRDWWGNPGTIPDTNISTPRGRLFKRKRRWNRG